MRKLIECLSIHLMILMVLLLLHMVDIETKESEILYTSVFSQEVQDQRDRIRPNSAYDDGTNSKKKRSHRQKKKSPDVVSDATDFGNVDIMLIAYMYLEGTMVVTNN